MSDEWVETTLGEAADISIGRTPPRKDARYWSTPADRPFCTIADMSTRTIAPSREGVTELAELEGKAKRVPAGSLLMSFKLTIGRIGFAGTDLFPNEAIAWLRVRGSNLMDRYLAYFLEAQDLTEGSGIAVKGATLNGPSLRAIRVSVPPLSVQARIVDLLEHLDTLIANLEQEREAVEALLVALRRDFFEGLDEVVELSKVLDAARAGGTPDRKRKDFYGGNIPWLKSGEVNNSFIQATEESLTTEGLSNSSAWLVPGGAVVVAMYGATAATVGFTGLAMAMNQAILALTPDSSKADARFLYHWMCYHSPRLKESATGAAQPNLSKAVVLREIAFPAMSLEDQAVMSADLDAALATMDALREEVAQLRVTRSATLTSLLSREIEIPDSYDELLGVAS